ncbi:alpha carbonic anhydrase 7 [Daucus carota subsp. sativus]|uniref:alpha carbonic anhydrase 7 n=1 Tax=Daucus carota subsp. sativus TaxID=79200 RepID=UPI0007F02869|nr:PREDICTED: alpha carbonic anhydrase 7-like [Daucus carota subsp. sativus]XP_017241285.1 PREDICTED: alpha carbonic anhydrase 7-like [Daucus carota subsp. sativus]
MFTTLHIRSAYMKTSAELRSCFNMTSGFLILSLLLIILHVMTVVTAQDGLRGPTCRTCGGTKSEFDYSKTSGKGPAFWGTLKTEWATCGTGKLQSPVDLTVNGVVDVVPQLETVTRRYKPCTNTMLTNKGTSIELEWVDGGGIFIKGKEYNLTNTHWHSPSEHTLNGNRFDLELHAVHADDEQPQNFAVISILYKIGHSPDPFLAKLERNISAFIADESVKEIERGVLDPTDIGISGREFYRYQGSLTTPPCTERVVWTVEEQIKTVSADQVELLQEAVDDNSEMNARPLQQLNGRDVRLYVDHST